MNLDSRIKVCDRAHYAYAYVLCDMAGYFAEAKAQPSTPARRVAESRRLVDGGALWMIQEGHRGLWGQGGCMLGTT